MLIAGGAESHARDVRHEVTVRFARIEASGLRVLRVAQPGGDGPERLVRWLAARTAVDRRGVLRWLCLDGSPTSELRRAADEAVSDGADVRLAFASDPATVASGERFHVVCGSRLLDGSPEGARVLASAWSLVAEGGVLIGVARLGAGAADLAEVARALEAAGIAVVDALACVADDAEHAVLEITRL